MKNPNKYYIRCISLITIMLSFQVYAANGPPTNMGQEPPGLTPKIFSPGFISLPDRFEYSICLTKDGRECYFSTRTADWSSRQIMITRYEDGQWTKPTRASFSNNQSGSPSLVDNDQSCYFRMGGNIYKITRTADGWSDPAKLGPPVSSTSNEWSCNISNLGNLWTCSWRPGGIAKCDIWRIKFENGQFTQAQNIRTLNTTTNDCDPLPGPDEKYVIWMSVKPGGFGGSDMYISFADGQGGWTAPKNLGPVINTSIDESAAYISQDHKYLFFTRGNKSNSDIYWVSIKAVLPDPNDPVFNTNTGRRVSSIRTAVNYAQSGQTIPLSPDWYKEYYNTSTRTVIPE